MKALCLALCLTLFTQAWSQTDVERVEYQLPSPSLKGSVSIEETLNSRRSRRSFVNEGVTIENLSQILWAAYGVTRPVATPALRGGLRTAPSAGARYPLEIYAIIGNIPNIEPGVYKYDPQNHKLLLVFPGDIRKELTAAALNQKMVSEAPFSVFYSAIYSRITDRYGERGRERYVCMDLGHSAQNVYLQAEALSLGTCAIGAFNDDLVRTLLQLPDNETPLYIMPIGMYK